MTTNQPEVQVLSSVLTAIITDNGALEQQLHVAYLFAQKLASLGIPVFPVWAPSFDTEGLICSCGTVTKEGKKCTSCKHPMNAGGHNDGTTDAGLIERRRDESVNRTGNPPNWGVPAGKLLDGSDLCVIDLDGAEGVANWNKLLDDAGLSAINPLGTETLKVYTSKGGVHIYLLGSIKQTMSEIAPKIDTRGDGKGYVVSPGSVHGTGTVYTPSCNLDDMVLLPLVPELKALLLKKMEEHKARGGKRSVQSRTALVNPMVSPSPEECIPEGSRNDTLFRLCSSYRARRLQQHEATLLLMSENSRQCSPPLDESEVLAIIENVYNRYPEGSSPTPVDAAAGGPCEDWKDNLVFTTTKEGTRGAFKNFKENVLRVLTFAPQWANRLRYNSDTLQVELEENGQWIRCHSRVTTQLARFCEVELGFSPKDADCSSMIAEAAHAHKVAPLSDELEGLQWDGVPRIGQLVQTYMGAEDTELNREVFTRQMIASVARIFQPGCQHDVMLVLQGDQGIRKSSFIRTLYGDANFTDQASLADCHNKDNLAVLVSKWAIEFPELSGMKRGDVEGIKKFITTRVDTFRPPYGHHLEDHPRNCVLWGTTNETHPLMDSTGNRRFHIIACTKKLTAAELKEIAALRPQLWAEAVHLYRQGRAWWFEDHEEHLLEQSAAAVLKHVEENPLDEKVLDILNACGEMPYVRAISVLEAAGLPVQVPRNYSLVKTSMEKKHNMVQQHITIDGMKQRVYLPVLTLDEKGIKHVLLSLSNGTSNRLTPEDLEAAGVLLSSKMHVTAITALLAGEGWGLRVTGNGPIWVR